MDANNAALLQAISTEYGEAEAERFAGYELTEADVKTIGDAGTEVLRMVPLGSSANACLHLSSLWASFIRDNTAIPVHVVVGNLSVGSQRIFHSDMSIADARASLQKSNAAWDGHAWIAVPSCPVGEISLFRTAYALPEDHWLRKIVTAEFGPRRGLSLGDGHPGWHYEPKVVLSDQEITSFIRGLKAILDAHGESL